MPLTPVPVGTDIQVNTTTANEQVNSAITTLADGGFVVTWSSNLQDGSFWGIYGQRFTAAGVAVGAEFQVPSITANDQTNASVAALPDGGFVVTWTSFVQDGNGHGIFARRFTAAGAPAGDEFQVNTTGADYQDYSSVAVLDDGGFVVTWTSLLQEQSGSGWGVYGQRYTAAGAVAGGEFQVNTYTTLSQSVSSVTSLADGSFVVTWTSNGQDGSGQGIYAQHYTIAGVPIGVEFAVNTTTLNLQQVSAIAALNDGGFVITWSSAGQDGSGWGIYGQRFTAAGVAVGAEFAVNTETSNNQDFSSVTALFDGGFVVTWSSNLQDGSGWGIYGQRFSAGGTPVGSEFLINSITAGNQFNESVYGADWLTQLANGQLVATWAGTGAEEVFVRLIDIPLDDIFTAAGDTVDLNAFDLSRYTLAQATNALDGNDVVTLSATQNAGVLFDGGAGNDTITGTAGSDWIAGGNDDDTLTGNGGVDTIEGGGGADGTYGGAGDDVFRFSAGDLTAGEIVDGGADTDHVELRGGAHSLVGVTLTGVEQIALTGTGATTVTLGDAAQALLFTSSAGGNDTVVFNGDFTPAQLDALAAAGIEHVQLVSNGNAVTANYTAGVLREIILQDSNNNDPWTTVTHTRDAAGVLTSLHTVFDNGIDEVISFVDGDKTTVAKTDLPGDPEYTWQTQLFTYDVAGTFLTSLLQTEDNGDTRSHTYTGGALTGYTFTDVSGSSPVDTFSIDYTAGGAVTGYQTVFDNGVVAATTYTAGVRSSYLQTDTNNIDPSYATFLQHFAANGVDVTDQIYTHDNGSTTATNFVAGGTMTGTAGNNTMRGAVGADTFIFAPAGSGGGGGNDYIANFESGVDHIDLDAYGFTSFAQVQALAVANGANGVYLTFSATNHLAVNGLSLANMTTDDFLL